MKPWPQAPHSPPKEKRRFRGKASRALLFCGCVGFGPVGSVRAEDLREALRARKTPGRAGHKRRACGRDLIRPCRRSRYSHVRFVSGLSRLCRGGDPPPLPTFWSQSAAMSDRDVLRPLVGGSARISAHAGPPWDLTRALNRRVRNRGAPGGTGSARHSPEPPLPLLRLARGWDRLRRTMNNEDLTPIPPIPLLLKM
jgi:hypothetical protein